MLSGHQWRSASTYSMQLSFARIVQRAQRIATDAGPRSAPTASTGRSFDNAFADDRAGSTEKVIQMPVAQTSQTPGW